MLSRSLLLALLACATVHAAPSRIVPEFPVNAKVDKRDTSLNFDKGMVAAIIDEGVLDSIQGSTSDLAGTRVPAFIVFDASVPEEKLIEMASYQGRLKGQVTCRRVRLGNSPKFPDVKLAVLGEQCAIKSLTH